MGSSNHTITRWFEIKKSETPRLRLYCWPHGGGGAATFLDWPKHLPPSVELWAVRLPGRERRFAEAPLTQMKALVDGLLPAIEPHLGELPYVFFGHSVGALAAFELARAIEARSELSHPSAVAVAGRHAPSRQARGAPIHALPEAEFRQSLTRFEGTPPEVLQNAELMDLFSPVLRADFTISETYERMSSGRLQCPLHVLAGTHDSCVSRDELHHWGDHTCGRFTVKVLDGGHFCLNERSGFFAELRSLLAGVAANASSPERRGDEGASTIRREGA